jgi:hypothetical protein
VEEENHHDGGEQKIAEAMTPEITDGANAEGDSRDK